MIPRLDRAVVLGAGAMGARIAGVLASAGASVRLLDIDAATAAEGLARALKVRPNPLLADSDRALIRTGGTDEIAEAVPGSVWVIEAVVEDQEVKRDLLAAVDEALSGADRPPIVSTNTSALSIARLGEERSDAFRRAFLGTHFFNPPRSMRLLELIPGPWLDDDRLASVTDLASRRLGKGTVLAKDTPGFIANRLGTRSVNASVALAIEAGLTVEEADLLTGRLIGRPRTGVLRLLDAVGIDVALRVSDDIAGRVALEGDFIYGAAPALLREMLQRGWCGDKTEGGFYRRVEPSEREVLDTAAMEYRPAVTPTSLARALEPLLAMPLVERLRALASSDDSRIRIAWRLVSADLAYAADVGPRVADDVVDVDRAMRWGWGWELGPFQMWDALAGIEIGAAPPDRSYDLGADPPRARSFAHGHLVPFVPVAGETPRRRASSRPGMPVNEVVAAHDLGHDVIGIELHGQLNVIGPPTIQIVRAALDLAVDRFDAAVIFTDAEDFSVGADLKYMLALAEDGDAGALDGFIRSFQELTTAIRGSCVPIIVAARGRTLGGGAELCLAATRVQAAAETAIGLVEAGVGLLPAGGGLMTLARRIANDPMPNVEVDRLPLLRGALRLLMAATPSESAANAREMGLFRDADLTSADPARQLDDALMVARSLAEAGYRPLVCRPVRVLGRRGIAALEALTWMAVEAGEMTDHDRLVSREIASVLCGGDVPDGTEVDESYLLDLEREGFLRLLATGPTRDRIRYTASTGRPLRN